MLYAHTVHMSHFGRSGTVLDTPNTLVCILNLTTIYCHTNAPECHIFSCSPCCISKKRYHSPPQRVSISIEEAFMSTEPPWFGTQGLDASPQGLGPCVFNLSVSGPSLTASEGSPPPNEKQKQCAPQVRYCRLGHGPPV